MQRRVHQESGFTLPELLVISVVVIGIIAAMLLLVRPNNYEAERRNASRRVDLVILMRAITEYEAKNGHLPPSIGQEFMPIASTDDGSPSLCDDLVPMFLPDLRFDPVISLRVTPDQNCAAADQYIVTGYTVQAEGGRVILRAPAAENKEEISVERWFPLF